jgi:hypothetical protein
MQVQYQHKVAVLQVVLRLMQKGCHLNARKIFSFIIFDKIQVNLFE